MHVGECNGPRMQHAGCDLTDLLKLANIMFQERRFSVATKDKTLWPSLFAFFRQSVHQLFQEVWRALLPPLSVILVKLVGTIVAWPMRLLRLLEPDPAVQQATALAFFNAKPCCAPEGCRSCTSHYKHQAIAKQHCP